MRQKQVKPKQVKYRAYRSAYTKEDITNAYNAVKERGLPIYAAAKMFGVPPQTLRDRLTGVVDHNNDVPGASPLLFLEEEQTLVDHVEVMAQLGYGYTHVQLQHLGGELAHDLGRRETSKRLSNNWLYGFLRRWKNRLTTLSPRSLETTRAKGSSPEVIDQYYTELQSVLDKYDLQDKPKCIYNLDETGLQPDHRPPNVIAPPSSKPQAITSPRSTTVTVYGCANAIGNSLPPYFVFKGVRYTPDLLKGASAGVKATMSETGWANASIFKKYLEEHFLPIARPDTLQPILLLYDGNASHVTPTIFECGKKNNVILFVLPPHTSHLLQPLDVAVFAPFKSYYHSECSLFMQRNMGQKISRYEMCEIACKAYMKAFTPSNIVAAFKKTGIYPFCRMAIAADKLFPAEAFREKECVKKVMAMKAGREEVEKFLEAKLEKMAVNSERNITKDGKVKRPSPGGRAITEGDYEERLKQYEEMRPIPQTKRKLTSKRKETQPNDDSNNKYKPINKGKTVKKLKCKNVEKNGNSCHSPQPSTSGMNLGPQDTDFDSDVPEEDKCCQCKCFFPPAARDLPYLVITKWAQCDRCAHWVHLQFCSDVKFVRRHGEFLCPHCLA